MVVKICKMSLPAIAFKQFCRAQFSLAASFIAQIDHLSGVTVSMLALCAGSSTSQVKPTTIKLELIGSLLSTQH